MALDMLYNTIGRKMLFALDAERAHGFSIAALKTGLHPRFDGAFDPRLRVSIAGLDFPNPLGMAAGYDKSGEVPDALLAMGFGHTEIGTITPQPQPGNPKPRIFRLIEDEAVINRLGFNSKGHAAALSKLQARTGAGGIVGVNIGANKTSEDFAADYVKGVDAFGAIATYFTVNISSPNTPGLRDLQTADPLRDLLNRVLERVSALNRHVPVFLKIAPDIEAWQMDEIAGILQASSVDALIVSNTTLSRAHLRNTTHADEAGGLSGKPLFERSTMALANMFERLGNTLPMIGVGGVHDAETAWQKIEAGASLVQLYTGLIYGGPTLAADILKGLSNRLDREGAATLTEIRGRTSAQWARREFQEHNG